MAEICFCIHSHLKRTFLYQGKLIYCHENKTFQSCSKSNKNNIENSELNDSIISPGKEL